MPTVHGSLRLRPTRIGFLVVPTKMDDVRRVMQVCSCLWGGIYNPIIPVCESVPNEWSRSPLDSLSGEQLTEGYLRFFEPDVFVEAEAGLSQRAAVEDTRLSFSQSRVAPLSAFYERSQRRGTIIPFGLNIFDLYKDLYEREFKFVPRQDHRVAHLDQGAPDDGFMDAAFGGFPREGYLAPIVTAYADIFNPSKLAPNAQTWTTLTKEGFRTPLHFTRHRLKQEPYGFTSNPIIFVADPRSSLDLIDLWNIRQVHFYVLPANMDWLAESRESMREIILANYRPVPESQFGYVTTTLVQFARSISDDRAQTIMQATLNDLPQGSWAFKLWYERLWHSSIGEDDHPQEPRRVRISAASHDFEAPVAMERDDMAVRFGSLSPEFASPHGPQEARWVNVLKLRTYDDEDSIAAVLPSDFMKGRASRLRLGAADATVSREGIVLPQQYANRREYFQLLTGRQAVTEWLARKGVAGTPSDAGRVTEQVLRAVGGFWGAHLLADRETLKLLDKMAKSIRRHRDGASEEYPDRAEPVEEWVKHIARRKNRPHSSVAGLDAFVRANILRLGLSVRCPNCMKRNWYSLHDLDETLTCERCLKSFDFPQGSLDFRHTPWQYRVVGPFSVPDYAGGAYATVLALRTFAHSLGGDTKLTYATGLDITVDEAEPMEVDFSFWYQRDQIFGLDDKEPTLVFGEAKSFAETAFKAEDIQRMKRLATKFPGAFLVFAVLKNELSDEERSGIGELALWGRERMPDGNQRAPVIVLTGTELFCGWQVDEAWREAGDRRAKFAEMTGLQLDNLWALADITQQIYLGLPDKNAH